MVEMISRMALPFVDLDMSGHVNVRVRVAAVTSTAAISLPSLGGGAQGYYNGGDLGTADTSTFVAGHDSLIMALAMALDAAVGIITVSEDPLLPGRYVLDGAAADWEILWDDDLTTADPQWFGFAARPALSDGDGIITADYQADRLWIARRPRWNRKKRERVASLTRGYDDTAAPETRSYGTGHITRDLAWSMVSGARLYAHDSAWPSLGAHVSGSVAASIPVSAAFDNDGSGYAGDDKLTLVGGTSPVAAVLNVDTVDSGGELLTVSFDDTALDAYTVKPVNPVTVTTDGGGSSATLTVNWEDGDPNIPLERLWEYLPDRSPIKLIDDDTRLTEWEYVFPADEAVLNDLDATILTTRSEAPPYYDLRLKVGIQTTVVPIAAAAGGAAIPSYPSYSALPLTATHGDLAYSSIGPGAVLHVFVAALTTGTLGMWIPNEYGGLFDDYVTTGGNAARLSTVAGVGSDTKSSLEATGWADASTSTATVTDVDGTIELNSNSGGNPNLEFDVGSTLPAGTYFLVMEARVITRAAGAIHLGATFNLSSGARAYKISLTHSAVIDRVSWVNSFNTSAGYGYFAQSDFTRLFAMIVVGATPGADRCVAWKASDPPPSSDEVATAEATNFAVTAAETLYLLSGTQAGSRWQAREYHLIALV